MKMSEFDDTPLKSIPEKGVNFRASIIRRNEHNRRDNIPSECKTPSILKKSRDIRQKAFQRMQVSESLFRASIAMLVMSVFRPASSTMIGRRGPPRLTMWSGEGTTPSLSDFRPNSSTGSKRAVAFAATRSTGTNCSLLFFPRSTEAG